jgi:hypothetical protein
MYKGQLYNCGQRYQSLIISVDNNKRLQGMEEVFYLLLLLVVLGFELRAFAFYHLSHALGNFSDRVSCFLPGLASDHDPSTMIPT